MAFGSHTTTITATASSSSITASTHHANTHKDNKEPQTTAVQVALRVRPLTQQDRSQPRFSHSTESDVIKTFDNAITIVPHQKSFTFDYLFDTESTQEQVFNGVGSKLVDRFIEGYNVTILAYGQTSSGKTYTMGTAMDYDRQPDPEQEGIIPRAMSALFERLEEQRRGSSNMSRRPSFNNLQTASGLRTPRKTPSTAKLRPASMITPPRRGSSPSLPTPPPEEAAMDSKAPRYTVHVSFVEIYNEELIDLLNPVPHSERSPVTIREDTKGHIYWTGVKEVAVGSTEDVLRYLQMGTQNRATGSTDMNAKSSRSHAIFSVTLKQEKWVPSSESKKSAALHRNDSTPHPPTPSRSSMLASPLSRRSNTLNVKALVGQMERHAKSIADDDDGDWMVVNSKFHFVDLAGSERLKRTAAEGDRRKEGININAGLLALGNVISALSDPSKKSTHVPYRDSKLTRLLQDSLGGNATTLMIACVSPAEVNLTETANTIKYAHRARSIKNKAERNEAEEWMTNDSPEFLRSMIAKLKNEVRSLKGAPLSPKQNLSHFVNGNVSPSSSLSDNDHHQISTCASSSATTTITVPDVYEFDSQALVADLRRQIEELQNEVTVTRERNQHVEKELRQTRQGRPPAPYVRSMMKPAPAPVASLPSNMDFQHLVEPVIEEYEKSISGLESQLAMARAALAHSDHALAEQEAKITQYEVLHENESRQLAELKARLAESIERERLCENYVVELEERLSKSANDVVPEQQVVIAPKQIDQSTAKYISDLEAKLAAFSNQQHARDDRSLNSESTVSDQVLNDVDPSHMKCHSLEPVSADLVNEKQCNTDSLKLLDDLAQKTKRVQELSQRLAEIDGLRNELVQLRDIQAEEIARLEKALDDVKADHEACQKELIELQTSSTKTIDELTRQVTHLTTNNNAITQKLQQSQEEIRELQKHAWDQEQDTQTILRLRLHELEKVKLDLHALRQMEEKQEAIIYGLEKKMAEMEKITLSLREQLVDRDKQIQLLEMENTEKTELAENVQKEMESVLRDISHMDKEKKQLELVIQVMEDTLRRQDAKTEKISEMLADLQQQHALRGEDLEEKRSTVARLSLSLQEASDRACRSDELTKMLEEELRQARNALEEQVSHVQRLEEQQRQNEIELQKVAALEARIEELDDSLGKAQEEHKKVKIELEAKQQELDDERQALEKQVAKNAALEKTIAELENTIASERALVAAKDTSGMIAELEEKLQTLQRAKQEKQEELETRLEQVEKDLEQARKHEQDQQQAIESLESSLQAMQNQADEAASQTSKSEQAPDALASSRRKTDMSLDKLAAAMIDREGSPDQCKRISALEKKIELLEKENMVLLHSSKDSLSSDGKDMEGDILRMRLEDQERQLQEKDAALARLESRLKILQDKDEVASTQQTAKELHAQLTEKIQDPQGQQELVEKLIQLTEDNHQLMVHVDDLEAQLVLQRSQLTLETKNLELEVMKLTAANDRLEKEMEQVLPRSNSGNNTAHMVNRDSLSFTSPPQTPRVSSPPPGSAANFHYKLQRDISSSSLAKLHKSGSYRSMTMAETDDESSRRVSASSIRSDATTPRPSSASMRSRTMSNVQNLPPPSAPPSNPLPPIPTPLPPVPGTPSSPPTSPQMIPIRSVSSPVLQRQNSNASTSFSELLNGSNLTSEQYDKMLRSLQRKAHVAENDVRAHQEVISKLEAQLSRSESSVREVKKQLDVINRQKDAYSMEIQNLRSEVTQIRNQQATTSSQAAEELKRLEEQLENEKRLKEKAEKARHILENRMDELMSKKNKFMCF
ncbi:hypothetical protein EC973_002687 [Apophysomyces ossiformis]|uniref:Kinesin motor domain-containing protein n=1 Tax=Apophysomyces ossiformis TaxID=679940 RepID=A0A8H7BI27_9FUNG|nr:hypothetical protein EC973_002687 [Apophysomyces ossiformis]